MEVCRTTVITTRFSGNKGTEGPQPNLHMGCQGTGATMLSGSPEQLLADSVPTSGGSHVAGRGDISIMSELSSQATSVDSNSRGRPNQRRRCRWTKQDNEKVMRCYYYATHSSFPTVGYRNRMHTRWSAVNPLFEVSEQRLADQARTILKRGFLSEVELNALKAAVDMEITGTPHDSSRIGSPEAENNCEEPIPSGHDPQEFSQDNVEVTMQDDAGSPNRNPPVSSGNSENVDLALQHRLLELFLDVKERPINERK